MRAPAPITTGYNTFLERVPHTKERPARRRNSAGTTLAWEALVGFGIQALGRGLPERDCGDLSGHGTRLRAQARYEALAALDFFDVLSNRIDLGPTAHAKKDHQRSIFEVIY